MEIVYRALFMFFFLWVITRVVGRATLGELSTFELLLYVTMGDLVQSAVTQQDFSVTGGVLAISVFALLTVGFSYVNCRWPRVRPVVHGVPVVVMRAGEALAGHHARGATVTGRPRHLGPRGGHRAIRRCRTRTPGGQRPHLVLLPVLDGVQRVPGATGGRVSGG